MVRTINEPLPTPIRPSPIASTSTARAAPPSYPASRIPIRVTAGSGPRSSSKTTAIPAPRPSVVKKRAPLGERGDNTTLPAVSQTTNRKPRPIHIVVNPISASSANSPTRPVVSPSIRGPAASIRPPRSSFTRLDAGMDEDVTQLLDMRPSSPSGATTDDDWFSGAEEAGNITAGRTPMPRKSNSGWGRAVEGGGRMMTPMNSQEIQPSTKEIFTSFPISRSTTFRLSTPPSSQEPDTASTPQRPSPPNRRRARPSPTPPRQTSAHPDETISTAEPSPNPRSKKNPRLALVGSMENLRKSASPSISQPTTAKGKGRPWAGTRESFSPVDDSHVSPPPDLSASKSTRRKSVASTKKRTSPKTKARKSLASTPSSAMARYAGFDPRRKTMTPAALRRIVGQNLDIGAGVDSVESSPSDDPLLLRPLHDYDTEVDSDIELDYISKSTPRRSIQHKGSQTEPRGKGKGRASEAGVGFASTLKPKTNTGSKKITTSFPFRPYSNLPAPTRKVPEWVPRTMKKKKVESEYDLDAPSGSQDRDEEVDYGNGSFDYDAGGFADGFASDGDSDRGGGGYEGDDTFMNILTRRDVGTANKEKSVQPIQESQGSDEEEEMASFSQVKASGYSPAPYRTRFMAIDPSSPIVSRSPLGDVEGYPSPPPSPPRFSPSPPPISRQSPSEVRQQTPTSSPSHDFDAADDNGQDYLDPSTNDFSYSPVHSPDEAEAERSATPSPVQPSQAIHLPEVNDPPVEEEAGDVTEEMDTSMGSEAADVTTEGISESWNMSNSTVAEDAVSANAVPKNRDMDKQLPSTVDTEVKEDQEMMDDAELYAVLNACKVPSDVLGPSSFDHLSPELPGSPTTGAAALVICSPVLLSTVLSETVETITTKSHHAHPYSPPQTHFSPRSPTGSPPSSPLRPSDAPPSTPSRRSKPSPAEPIVSPKVSHIASPLHSPRQVQTFDESARSSLSSSQIDETMGDTTVEAIGGGWESDDSVHSPSLINDQNINEAGDLGHKDDSEEDEEEEEEISGLFAEDERVDGEFEKGTEDADCMEEGNGVTFDSKHPSTPDASVDGVVAESSALEADVLESETAETDKIAPPPTNPPESELTNIAESAPPPTEKPAGDGKIVISLIPRIIKIEPGEDDAQSEGSEEVDEEMSDEGSDRDTGTESESEESEDVIEDQEEDVKFGDVGDEEEEAINDDSRQEDNEVDQEDATSQIVDVQSQAILHPAYADSHLPSTPTQVHVPLSTTPLHTPPHSILASQRAITPVVERTASPRQREQPPEPVSAAPSDTVTINLAARQQSGTTHRPSGLSNQITGDTPESSPARPIVPTQEEASQAASSSTFLPRELSESPFIDEGVSIRSAGKSLLAEMARAGGKGKEKELGGVVEVSSLDPRAAARAAAILKLNHNYIEHGILPSSSKSRSGSTSSHITQTASPSRSHHSRRKSYTSHHFESVASAQKLSPEELLNEAELEIVVNEPESIVGTPARKRREGTAISGISGISGITDLPVPGGWVRTPKRKCSRLANNLQADQSGQTVTGDAGKAWGIKEWKRLETVYKAEKDAWVKEREVRPMPGGLMAWARRSTMGRPSDEVTPWDEGRVVRRFLESEGVEKGTEGAWAEDVILLRIQALERRLAVKSTSSAEKQPKETANKRAKVDSTPPLTPNKTAFGSANAAAAPSTIKRVMGWMWGSSIAESGKDVAGSKEKSERLDKRKGRADGERPDSFTLGKPINKQQSVLPITSWQTDTSRSMKQVSIRPVTTAQLGPPPRSTLPRLSGRSIVGPPAGDISLDTSLLGLSTSSSATSMTFPPQTPRIYPSLNQSISQRSAAIKALFPAIHPLGDSTSSTISSSSVGNTTGRTDTSFSSIGLSRKTSVKDLARSFEDKGVLDNALRRVPSGQNELEKLKRIRSREGR